MFALNLIPLLLNPLITLGSTFLWYQLVAFTASFLVRVVLKTRVEINNNHAKIKPSRNLALLITGATSGIGLATAKYFHRRKFTVIVGYYSDQEPGFEELKRLGAEDNSILFVHINVRSTESVIKSHDEVRELLKTHNLKLHALVNNAGIAPNHPITIDRLESTKAVVETNLLGPMYMIRQFTPLLAQSEGSRVINVSSVLAYFPQTQASVYGATKAAVKYLSLSIGEELAPHKIFSVVVYPGNLLKNTGIMASSCNDLESVYNSLSEEEKVIYHEQFENNKKFLLKFQSGIRKHQGTGDTTGGLKSRNDLKSKINKWMMLSTGAIKNGVPLEESSLMDSFDNAICLKSPPQELYGGNRFFALVVSSMIESAGASGLKIYKTLLDYLNSFVGSRAKSMDSKSS